MRKYLMLGTEEPDHPLDQGLTYKGIYTPEWANPLDNQKGYISDYPTIKLEAEEQFRTPRSLIMCRFMAYVLTKSHIFTLGNGISGDPKVSKGKLRDFVEGDNNLERIVDQPGIMGNFIDLKGKGILLAVYMSESFRKEQEKEARLQRTGFLLHSATGDIENFKVLGNLNPTGTTNIYKSGKRKVLLLPNRENLEYYVQEETNGLFNKEISVRLEEEIIEVRHLNGYTVCYDNNEGYVVEFKGKHKFFVRTQNTDHFDPKSKIYLLAQASSLGLIDYKDKIYALFGMEEGKISVFKLEVKGGYPCSEYVNTVKFISQEKEIKGEASPIKNIKIHEDYVSFTLRNLYLRIGINHLIGHKGDRIQPRQEFELSPQIDKSEEKIKMEKYLKSLKKIYNLDCIWGVTHRISTWDSGEL